MPSAKKSKPSPSRGVPVPEARRRAAKQVLKLLEPGMRVALMTHVNADGDGAGSEIALWHLLTRRGVRAAITNPTPFPERFGFLLDKAAGADKSPSGVKYLERADAIVVLDIADLDRLGHLSRVVAKAKIPVACIDHHLSDGTLPSGPRLVDAAACATGELVYDLARSARWELTPQVARALYVAILTDTGGFRFSNTTPRTLQVAAHLLECGLGAEQIYREVYASEPEGKIRLLGEVLETLVVEPGHQLAWVTVPPGAMQRHGVDASDLDGVVEFARAVRGVDLAILFRELANGRIKVSFRSVGDVDVAKMAESFGGGGHRRAAGASLEGTLDEVQARVLEAARSVARP
jgi:phosphoesterase RecJ-like protein